MKPATVLLTHSPSALANYYGARALAALEAVARVQRNASEEPWTIDALAAAAADCDIIVSDRRAEGGAELLARLPRLLAFCRCAVDIRNVDVDAASAQGILVTRASAGFMTSVAEWIARRDDRPQPPLERRGAAVPRRRAAAGADGPRIARRHARPHWLRPDRPQPGRRGTRAGHARARDRPACPGCEPVAAPGGSDHAAGRGRPCRLPGRRDRRDREPDERRGIRSDEADGVFHQCLARQPGRRGRAAASTGCRR